MSIAHHRAVLFGYLVIVAWLPAAAAELALGPMPISLKTMQVPAVPGLLDGPTPIIINRDVALVLGKALFWDPS